MLLGIENQYECRFSPEWRPGKSSHRPELRDSLLSSYLFFFCEVLKVLIQHASICYYFAVKPDEVEIGVLDLPQYGAEDTSSVVYAMGPL